MINRDTSHTKKPFVETKGSTKTNCHVDVVYYNFWPTSCKTAALPL
ncbi:hypothetical protein SAMN05444008_101141 [Cnuella takakiae]|uniref:Uncharacterized protein n=1 Tax=Cnuella takakiae TaxID=1302690 RepID=A0A1M4SIZ3_9BACT|nr:hypothetical protein SAMN05444008_101141 [Cnuella takakiae]